MKKALIVTYYWPPSGGSGVQRWLKFTKYLREFGWEPIIYTPDLEKYPVEDQSLSNDLLPNLTVVKKKIWEPYKMYRAITGTRDSQTVSFLNEEKSPGLIQKISQWIRGNFFIPDSRIHWVKPSVKFLSEYLASNKVDVVITTGPPHSLHLIGLNLQKKLNVKWVADFRDPWTNIDFYDELYLTPWADRRHRKLEKEVVQNADAVISVGFTLADELKEIGSREIKIITNGYDSDDYKKENEVTKQEFSFVHVGLLSSTRSHPALWRSFANLISKNPEAAGALKIRLVGKTDFTALQDIKKAGILSVVEKVGYVSHSEVGAIQQEAFVLLLPINRTPNSKGIISGKVFEYMASGRPTLGVGDVDGDAARILGETKSGVVFDFDDEAGLTRYLENKYQEFKSGVGKGSFVDIERYSRRDLTRQLAELLNTL